MNMPSSETTFSNAPSSLKITSSICTSSENAMLGTAIIKAIISAIILRKVCFMVCPPVSVIVLVL